MNATIAIFNNIGTVPQADYMQQVIETNIAIAGYEIAALSLNRCEFEQRKRKQAHLMWQIEQAIKS